MRRGCAPRGLPAAPGHVPPARVCMADCIKHKQLYLIGLYPALITTNSQSPWTALLAPRHSAEQTWRKPLICNSANREEELRVEVGLGVGVQRGHNGDVTKLEIGGYLA